MTGNTRDSHLYSLYLSRLSLSVNPPERNIFCIRELLHAPGCLKAAGYKVHRDKKTNFETLDELTGAERIAVAYAAIHRKHHDVVG